MRKPLIFTFLMMSVLMVSLSDCFSRQTPSIEILNESIRPGDSFQVKVTTNSPMDEKAWVGIFKAELSRENAYGYISYVYLNASESGEYTMNAPGASGHYELRIFSSDPGSFLKATKLDVIAISPDEYTLTLLTEKVKPSQMFKVQVTTTFDMSERAWVGVFPENADKTSSSGYLSYLYVTDPKDCILELTAPGEPGNYELRFYSADPGQLIESIPFRTGIPKLEGISFKTDKTIYGPGEEILIDYTGHQELSESAWIGVFKKHQESQSYNAYLDYRYLRPKLKGKIKLNSPYTKGEYTVKMFYAETGPELLEPVSIEVSSSLDDESIRKKLDEKGKITLYGIYFDTDKSIVKAQSYPLIEQIAKMLNADGSVRVVLEGHTDDQGDDDYNMELSKKRVLAVAEILTTQFQVNSAQLMSEGFGETKPVAGNNTAEGRAKNRRVELRKL